jgi:phosphoribosyl 1,2-cyclic phosphodiesterase
VKFASLGSGSEGNALLISAASGATATTVMLDCGFGLREAERRLARFEVAAADIAAIVVTHEHQDHVGGVFKFARRHRIPVWMSYGTFQAVQAHSDGVDVRFCRDGECIGIGDLEFFPYTVPHDAREPLQFAVGDGASKLGVLTDVGQATPHLIDALGACDALVLECNHDPHMLAQSTYPPSLKRRISGPFGHLSNQSSAAILAAIDKSRLTTVIGAHLSQQNNTPALARAALCGVLDNARVALHMACQEQGFAWRHVSGL